MGLKQQGAHTRPDESDTLPPQGAPSRPRAHWSPLLRRRGSCRTARGLARRAPSVSVSCSRSGEEAGGSPLPGAETRLGTLAARPPQQVSTRSADGGFGQAALPPR